MGKVFKLFFCVWCLSCFSVKMMKGQEVSVDSITVKTENYISQKVEEVIDDRYGFFSVFKVFYHVCLVGDESRKESWIESLNSKGISSAAIQTYINEQINAFNTEYHEKLNKIEVMPINVLDDITFNLILKRERYEVWGYLATILLGALVGAIIGGITGYFVNIESSEDFPAGVIRLIQIVTFGIGLFFLFKFLIPLEEDIAYSLTDNIFNQISNMNIFERL